VGMSTPDTSSTKPKGNEIESTTKSASYLFTMLTLLVEHKRNEYVEKAGTDSKVSSMVAYLATNPDQLDKNQEATVDKQAIDDAFNIPLSELEPLRRLKLSQVMSKKDPNKVLSWIRISGFSAVFQLLKSYVERRNRLLRDKTTLVTPAKQVKSKSKNNSSANKSSANKSSAYKPSANKPSANKPSTPFSPGFAWASYQKSPEPSALPIPLFLSKGGEKKLGIPPPPQNDIIYEKIVLSQEQQAAQHLKSLLGIN